MLVRCVVTLLTVFLGISTLLLPQGALAQTEEHVLIVIDRSGSMNQLRTDGTTRFVAALDQARDFIDEVSALTRWYSIWSFAADAYTQELAFTDNKDIAKGALYYVDEPTIELTPLAMTMCDAIDSLLAFQPTVFANKRMVVESDGEENNTPATHECYGPPSSTDYPDLDDGSWEWKVRNKARTGDPDNDTDVPFPLLIDVYAMFDFDVTMAAQALNNLELGAALSFTVRSRPLSSMQAFFQGISRDSGGRYVHIADSAPRPQAGDVDGDRCVGVTDHRIVVNNYGQTVPPGDARADLNHDHIVDIYDRMIVLQNYGEGC
jgi:hypothetical protein